MGVIGIKFVRLCAILSLCDPSYFTFNEIRINIAQFRKSNFYKIKPTISSTKKTRMTTQRPVVYSMKTSSKPTSPAILTTNMPMPMTTEIPTTQHPTLPSMTTTVSTTTQSTTTQVIMTTDTVTMEVPNEYTIFIYEHAELDGLSQEYTIKNEGCENIKPPLVAMASSVKIPNSNGCFRLHTDVDCVGFNQLFTSCTEEKFSLDFTKIPNFNDRAQSIYAFECKCNVTAA